MNYNQESHSNLLANMSSWSSLLRLPERIWRPLLWGAGAVSLALGVVGVFLPVLPTTPFVLLAAACWMRASPRLHAWLLNHPTFGPILRDWAQHRAVPRRAKWLSSTMMAVSCGMLWWRMPQYPWLLLAVALVCVVVAVWMWRLPDAGKHG